MTQVTARILLWGISGSGKSTSLQMIHSKLQADLRGDLRREPTRLDPTVYYETMSITLGRIGGIDSQIEIVAVPGAPDQSMTRKQLLDEVDGIVLVLDCSPERIEDNRDSLTELRESLADYGRRLEEIPTVLQYNKRDLADPFAIEALHRGIGLTQTAVFETIATTGHGLMSTLTTISKHVVRARKTQATKVPGESFSTIEDAVDIQANPNATSHEILEAAILAEAESDDRGVIDDPVDIEFASAVAQPDWDAATGDHGVEITKPGEQNEAQLRIVSTGTAEVDSEGGLRLPLVLGDEEGHTHSLLLSIRLETLLAKGDD